MIMSFLRSTILRKAALVEHADVAGPQVAVRGEGGGIGFRLFASSLASPAVRWRKSRGFAEIDHFAVIVEQLDVGRGKRRPTVPKIPQASSD